MGQPWRADVTIAENTISTNGFGPEGFGAANRGIGISAWIGADLVAVVRDNTISQVRDGIRSFGGAAEFRIEAGTDFCTLDLTIERNTISNVTEDGLDLRIWASSGIATVNGTYVVRDNRIEDYSASGMYLYAGRLAPTGRSISRSTSTTT